MHVAADLNRAIGGVDHVERKPSSAFVDRDVTVAVDDLSGNHHQCPLLFAQALIAALCSSRKRSSLPSALRASAHRCPLLFAQALIAALCSSRKRSSLPSALRASAHRCPLLFAQ